MEFRILGPLEVVDEGRGLELGSARERALLALLVLHAGEILSTERIVEELWGAEPPDTAAKIVQHYVSHLRRALGPARDLIETRGSGYVLRAQDATTDVARSEGLVAEASGADLSARAALLREALSLWRGTPLADIAHESFAQHEIARLEEWRLEIVEERVAADLDLGAGAELVRELDGLVRQHPLRERLRAQHMLALYRAERQADALASCRELRGLLDEELGLEPGVAIRELERAILRQDDALTPRRGARPEGVGAAPGAADPTILVAAHDGDLERTLALAEALVDAGRPRELLLSRLVAAAELGDATRSLSSHRDALAGRGVRARVAAFTSLDPGADLVRLASAESVDLVLAKVGREVLDPVVTALLTGAPCDVGLHIDASEAREGPVMVPFGAARHDWAALELGAWLARGTGAVLQLIGAAADDPEQRDASRLLADASLVVQRATGVVAEPVLSRPGAQVAEVARAAGALVVGLPEAWRESGLGPVRSALAEAPPAALVFVHRGARPSGIAPPDEVSSFAWSTERSRLEIDPP